MKGLGGAHVDTLVCVLANLAWNGPWRIDIIKGGPLTGKLVCCGFKKWTRIKKNQEAEGKAQHSLAGAHIWCPIFNNYRIFLKVGGLTNRRKYTNWI